MTTKEKVIKALALTARAGRAFSKWWQVIKDVWLFACMGFILLGIPAMLRDQQFIDNWRSGYTGEIWHDAIAPAWGLLLGVLVMGMPLLAVVLLGSVMEALIAGGDRLADLLGRKPKTPTP